MVCSIDCLEKRIVFCLPTSVKPTIKKLSEVLTCIKPTMLNVKWICEKERWSSESTVCMVKIAASVLLKLFINSNERCHTGAIFNTNLIFSIYISGHLWSNIVCYLHFKKFCSCTRGRQWCGSFLFQWWTASIKPRLLFFSM